MRRYLFRLETIILFCVGLVGILFILNENDELLEIRDIEDFKVTRSSHHAAHSAVPQMEWVSKCQINMSVENLPDFNTLPPHIKDFLRYRHCKSFPQILNSPMKCGGPATSKDVFLLLAIKSSPGNYERRAIIRQTWGVEESYRGAKVKRIFLSGIVSNTIEDKRMRHLLAIESQTYGDILQWNFLDTFFNLTLKQVLFHQWLEDNCPGAHFIFNGDDDVFVNTFNVVSYLSGLGQEGADRHLFVGQLIANVGPIRESWSKYYVPVQVTSSNSYPMYCGGGGILMSKFTAHTIYNNSLGIQLFPIDDVYLGMCLEKAGLVPASHMGMRTVGVRVPSDKLDSFNPCYYRELLMVHRFVPYEMLVMWKAVQDPDLNCGQKRSVYIGM
ncbi:N-acetyllactosaminide beta-1,3-N-acetylglucosaminyltransferase 3 [Spea bombifrons]|uniref:N-acetyllactosaminide beta-1,3-N-acetylglucosaminyltransferase 3 n=1 Tax=Spea bombifrons TaxID=233779 RepID=UPI002349B22A|nr:N-acetyllactosaminide beta-1,3-N-acetylglucosaminyltransferase 3 [Spea bombifrons]